MNVMGEIIEPFLAKADTALGTTYSAVLYGSVARGEYVAGLSDVNLMLILDRLDGGVLDRLETAFNAWVAHKLAPPLLMTSAEWRRADDVFPVEITDMKAAYRVLRGTDPLNQLAVSRSDLRKALEREFRGKLTRLRQGFVPSKGRPEDLTILARQSIASVTALYRALLVLAHRASPPEAQSVLTAAGALVGFDRMAILSIAGHRGDAAWTCERGVFEGYMQAVERTVTFVDELQLGDQE